MPRVHQNGADVVDISKHIERKREAANRARAHGADADRRRFIQLVGSTKAKPQGSRRTNKDRIADLERGMEALTAAFVEGVERAARAPSAGMPANQLVAQVRPIVEAFAAAQPAVERAFVQPDGMRFLLLGSPSTGWSAELSEAAAGLSVALQRALLPSFDALIEGTFEVACNQPLEGLELVYDRR